jgi:hypothetical protein
MPIELKCGVCSGSFTVRPSRQNTSKYCSFRCHQIGCGRKGGRVSGEQKKAASEGKAYTKTFGRHTHRVVMEQMIGRLLVPGEVVHHRDGNFLNNSPDNLELCASQAEHMEKHRQELLAARKKKHGY